MKGNTDDPRRLCFHRLLRNDQSGIDEIFQVRWCAGVWSIGTAAAIYNLIGLIALVGILLPVGDVAYANGVYGYDYFEQTRKPPTVSVVNGRYVVSKPLSHEVVQPQLASNYTLPEAK